MGLLRDLKKKEVEKSSGNAADEFWETWVNSDELERISLVRSLNVFELIKDPMEKRAFENLVNSYLVDLHNYMLTRVPEHEEVSFVGDKRYGRKPVEDSFDVSQLQP